MQNIIFVISTLQETDSFFSFASGLKDKNKNLNVTIIIESQDFYQQLKKNKSLFLGLKKIGRIIYKRKKNKLFQKIYNFFWILKLIYILVRLDKPCLLTGGNFHNLYRIILQFVCIKKEGKCFILNPNSFIWYYQYKQFRKNAPLAKSFKKNFWQKFLNLKIKGFIFYNNKQLPYAKIIQKKFNFKSHQLCLSGLGSDTNYYKNFFLQELRKYKKKLSYLKNSKKKKIFSIICGAQGTSFGASLLLKEDSQKRTLKLIIDEIIKYKKDSIILLRRHPNDNSNKSHVLEAAEEAKIKKNIFFTTLHPQILSKISSRLITYTRTNVMTDILNTKKIDCSEYKKVDLNRNNGKYPGNYGYGVIYINPQKKDFTEKFKQVLVNDKYYKNKKIYMEEKKLLEKNYFNYEKIENFINNV